MADRYLDQLRDRYEETIKLAEDLQNTADAEDRAMTVEEKQRFDELLDEKDEVREEIGRRERLASAKSENEEGERRSPVTKPENNTTGGDESREFAVASHGSLRAFKGPDARRTAYRCGMWTMATLYGNQRARDWCLDHGVISRAMGTNTNTGGGALVPDEFENAVIDLREQYGVARRLARVVPMSSDHMVVPRRTGGLTAYAVGDNDSITASDKTWDNVELTARKWAALAKYSSELAEDAAVAIADDLANEMAWAFEKKADESWIDGDGTSTYHGIVGLRTKLVDGNHGGSTVAAATAAHDTFAEIDKTDLANVIGLLPEYARANARWLCSSYAYAAVFQRLLAAQGGATMRETEGGTNYSYMGFPVVISQAMPASSSTDYTGVVMIMLGDFSLSTTMGSRRGIRVRVSEDRYLEYDQLAVVGTTRYDIVNHDLGDSSNAGPVVGLLGGSG